MLDFESDLPSRGFLQMKPCGVLHISSFQNLNQGILNKDWRRKILGGRKMVGEMSDGHYVQFILFVGIKPKERIQRIWLS